MLQCEHWLLCKQTRIVNQPIKMFTNTFTRVIHSWCKIKELNIKLLDSETTCVLRGKMACVEEWLVNGLLSRMMYT